MANLPSKSFMFNYSAKDYDTATRTFHKAQGQLFDEDITLNGDVPFYDESSLDFRNKIYFASKIYNRVDENPFNRSSSIGNSFTFIYKAANFNTNMANIFANRNSSYNYMVRGTILHTSSPQYLTLAPPSDPHICVIRINSDGTAIRKFVDESGNTITSTTASSVSWGGTNDGVGFFAGFASGSEWFNGIFYWMYCSMEALTDEEILQVIQYNNGSAPIEISIDSIESTTESGSSSVTITTEDSWSASTQDSWITISQSSGVGTTTILVNWKNNIFQQRTGTVTFTDTTTQDEVELTITQEGNTLVPYKKIFINGNRIN